MKRVAIAFGSMFWGLIVFRIALGIHFPTDAILNRLAVETSTRSQEKLQLKVEDVGLASFIGAQVNNAILYQQNDSKEYMPYFFVDHLQVALSPFKALMGSLGLSVAAETLGGSISAYVTGDSFQPSTFDLTADATQLDLSSLPIDSAAFTASLTGFLSTHIEGSFPQELSHKNSDGRFTLSIDGLGISDAKASGIELPALQFSQFTLEGLFSKGKIEITDANIVSDSIGLTIDGDIMLAKQVERSRLRLTLNLRLGSEFSLIARMVPQLKNNHVGQEDGKELYKLDIIGTLQNPRIKGGAASGNKGRAQRAKPTPSRDLDDDDIMDGTVEPDQQSVEDKRRERRERIEARKRAQEERKQSGAFDLPDNPRRDLPNRPLQRVPTLEEEDEVVVEEPSEEEVVEEVVEDVPEENQDNTEPSDDQEPSDEE